MCSLLLRGVVMKNISIFLVPLVMLNSLLSPLQCLLITLSVRYHSFVWWSRLVFKVLFSFTFL